MSAFICSSRTFSSIYHGLEAFNKNQETGSFPQYSSTASEISDWIYANESSEEIIKKLYGLNVRAVNERYGMRKSKRLSADKLRAICSPAEIPTVGQFLKSLVCLQYQMSEGSVPRQDGYNDLGRVIRCLREEMAGNEKDLAEYREADWD